MKITIIKVGGKLVDEDSDLNSLCERVAVYYPTCVLVHGGGNMAGRLSEKLGITPKMHEGRRITDAPTLDITVMTYAGLVNKRIVAKLQTKGVNACGLSGCDMNIILSHKRAVGEIDWGFVGDIEAVNVEPLTLLLQNKILPVISPITCSRDGQLLNTNADSVASAVAIALSGMYETELIYCFDKPGVLLDVRDDSTYIPQIDKAYYKVLLEKQVINLGMLPKLENAFKTLEAGVKQVRLTSPKHLDGGTVIV
ncbi:acetylglutamate kinase [Bacteroidia bacterium]|nr:acetylglutamate kinase [Bacteroidia bacterium]